ncbi:hypothetical protein [Sphingopyxis sp. 550A]
MDIRTFSLDADLTVAEIDPGTDSAWHFLPFEDRRAELIALDERYLLAIGRRGSRDTSVAIFDTVKQHRTNIETSDRLNTYSRPGEAHPWCYAPTHRSVFVIESTKKRDFNFPNPAQYLRQLSVDGKVNRRIAIAPDFHAHVVLPRDDGHIICVGLNEVAVLDPISADVRVSTTDLIAWNHLHLHCGILGWFSPDGRWALRPHLGSVIRSGTPARDERRVRAFLSELFSPKTSSSQERGEGHPDLARNKGRSFGLALELFRLDPLGVERRLVICYYSEQELSADLVAVLDPLADRQDHRAWNGHDQLLLTCHEDSHETRLVKSFFERIDGIKWDEDCQGFTVGLVEGTRKVESRYSGKVSVTDVGLRHVSLEGDVGQTISVPGELEPEPRRPSDEAINAIEAMVRERSSHLVECAGWTGHDVAKTLMEIRRRIEERGLDQLVFGEQLQFRFRVDKRTIGEKKFFETIRKMAAADIELILPELRHLMRSYGSAARQLETNGFGPIASGPSNHSPGALSEAALTLAMLDDTGFEVLRDWIRMIDQEHDYFAAAMVFPAMARRTRFKTVDAIRFGLWFFIQQWQTVKYERDYLGLFKAAPNLFSPASFASAVLTEARDVVNFSKATSVEVAISNVQQMLGRNAWDRAASAELDRLAATLDRKAQ